MKNYARIISTLLILSLALILVACGPSGSAEPTQALQPAEPAAPEPAPVEDPETDPETEPTEAVENPETVATPTEMTGEEEAETAPTQEEAPIATKTPFPENEIFVETTNTYWDNFDNLHVVGLVTNLTAETLDSIAVEIKIFDSTEALLYTINKNIILSTLAPGETSPFSHQVNESVSDRDSYATAVIISQNPTTIERATIQIKESSQVIDDYGYVHVVGKLVNNTQSPVMINGLAAAIFDENGTLYSAESFAAMVLHLDPGEDSPFRVTMTGPAEINHIDKHEIYVDAINAIPVEYVDLAIAENHNYYLDSSGGFHLIGQITNNAEEYLTLSLVASIYDENGKVVDANTTEIPTFSIAPGETQPYDFQYWGPLDTKAGTFGFARTYYVQYDPYWTLSSPTGHIELDTQNNVNQVDEASQAFFIGEVVNTTNDVILNATVIVNLIDTASGELLATGFGLVNEPIAPNGTANYEVWINAPVDFDIDTVDIEIAAKGDQP